MTQKRKRFETKSAFKNRLKKRSKKEEKIFIGILVLGVIYYLFFKSVTIGGDYRYGLYIFWIPTIIVFFLAIKYSFIAEYWSSLLEDLKKEKYFLLKIFYPLFLVIMTFMYSVILFWIPSSIILDTINKIEAHNNKVEVREFQIVRFQLSRSSDSVIFYFNDKLGSIPIHYEDIKPYLDKNPRNYRIKLEVRKGIWNYYIVDSYDVL